MSAVTAPRRSDSSSAGKWQPPDTVETGGLAGVWQSVRGVGRQVSKTLGLYPAGWLALLTVIVCAIAGGVLAWVELRYLAVFVGVILAISLALTFGRPRYGVDLGLSNHRVVVGQKASGGLLITNRSTRRTLPARIDLPVGSEVASFTVPSLAPENSHPAQFVIPTERRGVVTVGPARSVQGDPFGLAGRETEWTGVEDIYVHPRTVSVPGRMSGLVHDLEGQSSTKLSNSDMSFHALREYVSGDDRRHVHWLSTARLGRLMVRQFEETLQSRVVVALDLASRDYLDDDNFEIAVEVAASLAMQCLREENPLSLRTNFEVLPAVSPARTLDEFAKVTMSSRSGVRDLVHQITAEEAGVSVVFVVTGAGRPLVELRQMCELFSPDVRVIGIQVDPAEPLSVRASANVSVVRLPQLGDLARGMRRAME